MQKIEGDALRGHLEKLILAVLQRGDAHGLEIIRRSGRSSARSPGSNGGSPSSRSPSGLICGGRTALPPAAETKASARARAPLRVGVSTVACDSASGPSGLSAS